MAGRLLLLVACGTPGIPVDTDDTADTSDTADIADTLDTGPIGEGWCAVQSILRYQCAYCHAAELPAADLDLTTDPLAELVNQPSNRAAGRTLVIPGDPDGSFVYDKVTGALESGEGNPMPPNTGLDAAYAEYVRAWIADGATDACGADTAE